MNLKTLLGTKQFERNLTEDSDYGDVWDFKEKFFKFVVDFDLNVWKEDSCFIASDESGEMRYKKIKDFEWFQWKPYQKTEEEAVKNILNIQEEGENA